MSILNKAILFKSDLIVLDRDNVNPVLNQMCKVISANMQPTDEYLGITDVELGDNKVDNNYYLMRMNMYLQMIHELKTISKTIDIIKVRDVQSLTLLIKLITNTFNSHAFIERLPWHSKEECVNEVLLNDAFKNLLAIASPVFEKLNVIVNRYGYLASTGNSMELYRVLLRMISGLLSLGMKEDIKHIDHLIALMKIDYERYQTKGEVA